MPQRAGSKRSASPSTKMPNRAWPHSSSSKAVGNVSGGSPARHRASSSAATCLHEVAVNQQTQLPAGGDGHHTFIRDDGVRERRSAFAGALSGHGAHGRGNHGTGVRGVLHQVADDIVHGHGVVMGMPAVIV